jgi:tetratricopeptide (TPR) repeat protein
VQRINLGLVKLLMSVCLIWGGQVSAEVTSEEAQAAYEAKDWAAAAQAFRALSETMPDSPGVWYRLGISLGHLGRVEEALGSLETAAEKGAPRSFVKSGEAQILAANGSPSRALAALNEAVQAGYSDTDALEAGAEYSSLRELEEFGDILELARRQRYPCEYDQRYRQFDFWIGDWEVFMADGRRAGSNSISKSESGCLLLESWSGASGGSGTSMNFFDAKQGQWVQVWVSGDATLIDIRGGMDEGSMVLTGTIQDAANPDGAPFRGTWTLLDDGRVRQFFEQGSAAEDVWTPWFEGFYVRQDPANP